jgi:hypothetical protein
MLAVTVLPEIALASTAPHPHVGSVCLRERAVLRPKPQADADGKSDGRIIMVRVAYCDLSRPVCLAGEDQVAMSRCRQPNRVSE